MGGLIFGGAYLRREICVPKSIGLALQLEVDLPFSLCFAFIFEGNFPSTSPQWGLFWEGPFNGGFFASPVWRAYKWRGLFSEFYGIGTAALPIRALFYTRDISC